MRMRTMAVAALTGALGATLLVDVTDASWAARAEAAATTPSTRRCYDQLTVDTGLSNVSDKYEAKYHAYDSRAADDFTLTKRCKVRSVDVDGTFYDGVGPAESEQLAFYVDDAGSPGKVFETQRVIGTYVFGQGNFHLVLNRPVVLEAGTYWLSVRANMIFDESGQWGWNSIDHQVGALPMWKNPLDGFATGCTHYEVLATCVGGDPNWYLGLGFALNSTKD